ncbi:39S ribosomal protein L4 [Huso huso]|uniref:Large ribosomal subunit protein uL4m n=1 Tax=Huso huso TaxID=61971 RepID=A0ABR0ZYN9_HUSHU
MFRISLTVCCREIGKRLLSTLSEEGGLPSNLRLAPNLVGFSQTEMPPAAGLGLSVLRQCEVEIPSHLTARQAWLESLRGYEDEQLGLVDLHPDIFAVPPRLDILHEVAIWQKNFKRISHAKVKTRAEVRGGGRKPWQQKGSGRARHGSIRSPLWRGGGLSLHNFYIPLIFVPLMGLKVALRAKLAQDYLHIVDSQYILDLAQHRHWGDSVLIVDVQEDLPENILKATEDLKTINIMPAIGELSSDTTLVEFSNTELLHLCISQNRTIVEVYTKVRSSLVLRWAPIFQNYNFFFVQTNLKK